MRDYILSCCSTADLTREHFERRNIKYVCFHYTMDGVEYPDDLGETMSFEEFYQRVSGGAMPTTSQVNVEQYIEFWEPFLREGKDILHLTLSSGISGTYNSACVAREELKEKYPDRTIYVVDSLCAASGYGMFMTILADMRDQGATLEELHQWAEANKLNVQHWVYVTDLSHLKRGGRISAVSAVAGSILNICPIIKVNVEGKLLNVKNVRGRKKAMDELFNKMKELAADGENYSGKCYVAHSACEEEAKKLAGMVEAAFPNLQEPVCINSIGAVIGSHTGPGTIVIFFMGEKRVD